MKEVNCIICTKGIDKKKEDYFKVDLFLKGKKKATDYTHVICWENRKNYESDLQRLIRGIASSAKDLGVLKEEGVVLA